MSSYVALCMFRCTNSPNYCILLFAMLSRRFVSFIKGNFCNMHQPLGTMEKFSGYWRNLRFMIQIIKTNSPKIFIICVKITLQSGWKGLLACFACATSIKRTRSKCLCFGWLSFHFDFTCISPKTKMHDKQTTDSFFFRTKLNVFFWVILSVQLILIFDMNAKKRETKRKL